MVAKQFPISPAIAARSARLPGEFPGDPAGRLIVAAALDLGVSLVTRDGRIRAYPHAEAIW